MNVEGMEAIDKLAETLIQAGLDKDIPALREIGDRVDGKVPQAIVGDPDEAPVQIHEIRRVIVDRAGE